LLGLISHFSAFIFLFCFRFFTAANGVQIRLLDMKDLPGEDSQLVADFITQILQKHGLKWENLVSFCADNAPVNFGGPQMQGPKNVFKKLVLKKKNLIPIGCPAHIFHNAAQKAADRLPLDIETIAFKLASYFKGSTSRNEQFKDICDFLEVCFHFLKGFDLILSGKLRKNTISRSDSMADSGKGYQQNAEAMGSSEYFLRIRQQIATLS
jgi:hypothetical protein